MSAMRPVLKAQNITKGHTQATFLICDVRAIIISFPLGVVESELDLIEKRRNCLPVVRALGVPVHFLSLCCLSLFGPSPNRRKGKEKMAKRQALPPTSASTPRLPKDLLAFNKEVTDVFDQFTVLIPQQTSPITVGTTVQKVKMELPNTKSLRLDQVMLECTLLPGFSSTSGSDTFNTIRPQFVPLIPSILNRVTMFVGSATFFDNYANDLRYNLQYWTSSNPTTRFNDLYMYPTNNLAPATAVPTTVRFPLVWRDDFPNLNSGFFPSGILPKISIDLYFSPAANCMYTTQASPVGTVTLNYTVSDIKFKVEDVSSDLIASALASRSLNFTYTEWYNQQTPITPSAQSIVIQLPNNFRYVSAVIAVIRKTSDITSIIPASSAKLKYYTGDVTEITKANVRENGELRYPEPLSSTLDLMHELKKVRPCVECCDYFQDVTTNSTTHMIFGFRLGRSISEGVESGVNCASFTAPTTLEITFSSALGNNNYVIDTFTLHTRFVSIGNGGFSIEE